MPNTQTESSEEFDQVRLTKSRYNKTSMKKKQILIDMVQKEKLSVYRASKKLKISNSTAKSIINNYMKYGIILERNTKSQIAKIDKQGVEVEPEEVLQQEVEKQALVKQQEAGQPLVKFTEQERQQIIRKMGILYETAYPFFEASFPFVYKNYRP